MSKNKDKNYCTHYKISGNWVDKCWKLHPKFQSKNCKGVLQAPILKEVEYESFFQPPKIEEESYEQDQLSKEDSIKKEQAKDKNPFEWFVRNG